MRTGDWRLRIKTGARTGTMTKTGIRTKTKTRTEDWRLGTADWE